MIQKVLKGIFLLVAIVLGSAVLFLFAGRVQPAENVIWGVGFSEKHAKNLGLDWKAVYTALLDEMQVKHVKLSVDWNEIEAERGAFSFDDTDWQVEEAHKRNAEVLLVVGMKTLRWPECHVPEWAKELSKEEQQQEILQLLEAVVLRYKDSRVVTKWQVENEPLFMFGHCPWKDSDFFKKEIAQVKQLDPTRPVVVSDTGELSFWIRAARAGDMVSATMYRKVWFHEFNRYFTYPLPPTFYGRKAQVVRSVFGKEVMGGELQAEPWGPGKLLYDTTIEEQDAAFDLAQFRENIIFARESGIAEHYLWGAEWWYWRKEKAADPTFWQEAQKLFKAGL
ncbi:MAG TPA: endo-1,4-beta-xylanase [Candidatus Paceibacterota bacterium]